MRLWFLLCLVLAVPTLSHAQSAGLTLDAIWQQNAFRPEGVFGLRSMKDGLHYTATVGSDNGKSIVQYAYATGQEVGTVVKATELLWQGAQLKLEEYSFNADEKLVLIATEPIELYRHSSSYVYYIFDLNDRKLRQVANGAQVFHATFSPSSDRVAYVKDNDLWVEHLATGTTQRVTTDGKRNAIINGMSDWVYEEEFSFTQAFQWSPDGTYMAYYRFDESQVKEFTMTRYDGQLYPTEQRFKYPKAGEANAIVSIHIADLGANTTAKVDIGTVTDQYIPRIKWTTDPKVLSVQRLNRLQNKWELLLANAATGASAVILSEKSRTYIDITDNLTFLESGKGFIVSSEKDGYNHLYLHDMKGAQLRQLTKGAWDLAKFHGVDATGEVCFYESSEEGPSQRHVYSVNLDGNKKQKLTPAKGQNEAGFSKGMKYFINSHSDADTPPFVSLHDAKGKQIRVLKDNARLKAKLALLDIPKKEFFTFTPSHGIPLNGWVMKPTDMDPKKKYPVLIHIYGGPGSNYVNDSWEGQKRLWHAMLAKEGIIVVAVDNRGTGNRGMEFKHSTYLQLGKLETEDYIETAKYLATLPFVDSARIGIYGWSYGGYMSSLAITKGADHFKAAVAVAPVTNWRYYDNIYTERFMRTPKENPHGYDLNSPVNHVDKLRGGYLLVHGSGDDNVHFQNSMAMIDALVAANKPFDLMVYPDLDHAIQSKHSRLHLYSKITDFLRKNL